MPDKQLERTLNGLQVHCTHRREGCEWKGELRELESHLNQEERDQPQSCEYVTIECKECRKRYPRRHMGKHTEEGCPETLVPCKYRSIGCQEVIRRKNITAHVEAGKSHHLSLLLNHTHNLTKQCMALEKTVKELQTQIVPGNDKKKPETLWRKPLNTIIPVCIVLAILHAILIQYLRT